MMLCRDGDCSLVESKNRNWLGSRKFDGVRCIAICDGNVKLVGRNGTDYTLKFPEVVDSLKSFSGVIDGEVVCCDNFQYTQSRILTDNKLKQKLLVKRYPANYYVFDILNFKGVDLKNKILAERYTLLRGIKFGSSVCIVENDSDLVSLFEKAKKCNWEGIIIKNPNSKYREGYRSPDWLKIKLKKSKDIKFVKFERNPAGIRVEDKEGISIQITGKNSDVVEKKFKEKGYAVIEVEFLEEFASGKLRQPVFKCLK